MPWIELHSNLREHPKTASIVVSMGFVDADHAVGKLSRLWLWALEYAPDGNLDQFTDAQLAVASGVDQKDGDRWVAALRQARWLDSDPRLRIHDWWDYVGYYLKKKWDKTPQRWKAVEQSYQKKPPDDPGGAAAEPQRNRSGAAAEPHTLTLTVHRENAGAREGLAFEVPDRSQAVAQTAVAAIDPEFAGYVFDDWSGRGGRDGAGQLRPWLQYVTTRWNRERKQWADGTHKGKADGTNSRSSRQGADRNANTANAGKASQYRGVGKVAGV